MTRTKNTHVVKRSDGRAVKDSHQRLVDTKAHVCSEKRMSGDKSKLNSHSKNREIFRYAYQGKVSDSFKRDVDRVMKDHHDVLAGLAK